MTKIEVYKKKLKLNKLEKKLIKRMKKFLAFLIFTLVFCTNSFSKISKIYYDLLVDGCMETAIDANYGYNKTKKYCTCTADHLDKNYTDESLLKLVEMEGGGPYMDVVNYVSGICREKVGLY